MAVRVVAVVLTIPLLVGLGILTLAPTRVEQRMPGLVDRVLHILRDDLAQTWLGFVQLEMLANVAVFVPVGILAFVVLPRRVRMLSVAVGPVLSVLIELWQAVALPERVATLVDVLMNSAGSTLGVLIALTCALIFRRRPLSVPSPTLETS